MNVFDHNKHLTEEAIALYTEALKLEQLDQLPDALKAHIESCDQCHQQAIELYALIAEMDYSNLGKHPSLEKAPKKNKYRKLRIGLAAIAASLSLILYYTSIDRPIKMEEIQHDVIATDDTPSIDTTPAIPQALEEQQEEEKIVPPPTPPRVKEAEKSALIAANFEVSDDLEGLVGAIVRDNSLKINKPSPEASVKAGQIISFAWQEAKQEAIFLIILNNREEEQLRIQVDSGAYEFTADLPQGLYYWKLESEEDLFYVGKFFIR